jgi:Icc-related predicted phosphoesterase
VKVLAAADVHGRQPVYEWLLTTARQHSVETILLAGDLFGCLDGCETPEEAQRHESHTLAAAFEAAGIPVLYIMGNDDLVELESRSESVRSIHGRRLTVGPFHFVGYQYSLPSMGGVNERPEPGIAADLETLTDLVDTDTVFVSHSPALGILDPGIGGSHIGSLSLREFLERHPCRAHIHGHSHEGFGRDGNHFNVACGGHARAMILDLRTMQHQLLKGRATALS